MKPYNLAKELSIMKELKSPKKPLIFYYVIAFIIILLLNALLVPIIQQQRIEQVNYNTFLTMIADENVDQVELTENSIVFTSPENEKAIYETGRVEDPDLVERLYNAKVDFTQVIPREASPLLNFFLTWILPILIFIGIGQLFARNLQKRMGGKNAMSFGKNKSKIYVEAES